MALRISHRFVAIAVLSLIAITACDSNQPTPAPTPTPPPTTTPPPPPPPPPPPAPAALESITLSASSVQGQAQPTATVKLTAPAPAGNAVISLQASHDVAKVPANVSVAAGETTNAFRIDTSTVIAPTAVTITATYQGVTVSTVLTVLPPSLVPRFSVSSPSKGNDACSIVTPAGAVDCRFDASASQGFVATFRWTLTVVNGKDLTIEMPGDTGAIFTPMTDCAFLSGGSASSEGIVAMLVVLRLEDRQGNVTNPVQQTVAISHNAACGY